MSKVIELIEEVRAIDDELFFADENDYNYEEHKKLLESLRIQKKWSIEQTAMYYADMLVEQTSVAKAKKEISDKVAAKAKTAQNKADYTKQYLKEILMESGINKISTDYCNVSISAGRKAVFVPEDFDAATLPQELFKYTPESFSPRKVDITRLLKDGVDVCGLELISGEPVMTVR